MYWGTGNPGPDFNGGVRPGNNLYTSSVVAFDPDDGQLRWHYQWTPHDVWDYDGVNENILFEQNGRKLLAHFDKNGYLFILDRTDGQLVRTTKFGRVTWADIDSSTGQVDVKLTPSGIHSNPITYSVSGKQYVAIPTGWGGWVEGYAPAMYGAPRGTALFVFALP